MVVERVALSEDGVGRSFAAEGLIALHVVVEGSSPNEWLLHNYPELLHLSNDLLADVVHDRVSDDVD